MIEWSKDEKEIITSSETSKEAVERYFKEYPQSTRTKSSIYTYWWWRKQEERKKTKLFEEGVIKVVKPVEKVKKSPVEKVKNDTKILDKIIRESTDIIKNIVVEKVNEEILNKDIIEVGDMVKYARTPDAPVGIVISVEQKKSIPMMSQKIKVRFGNYYVRDVYICDYKIVKKGVVKL